MQAKVKRLARFKMELSQPVESMVGTGNQNSYVNSNGQLLPGRQNTVGTVSADVGGDYDDTVLPDSEGPKSTTVITGLCPDMCPVSEREERERKGDLDQYERLDGDRNRTNKSLAVKKYNRMAEREANLIRPMPVLKKTIDYLLYLLDQPYDEKFLGLYNFLWDRMRAIRMDLRMQHLFNLDSITMLEQMIRLHIIAMHELCEYTKGEGFSEGFDAHLNIEQMNKTSVELFQLYDDHRKKGINVPTEKEFRGYYALLKLDKHPGYKVEPAELSHELSKMTPEIRQTQEVLFARDVARACRTGNFIAFFRLARKASYLQACLMHAHFAKLRTQALASLHSGLQSNQGIPVVLIAKWLAMEGEDVESLLEYHGFLIREFDEPYMVKDGQFFNSENDFPLKCSELVHQKKAEMICEDVSSSISVMPSFAAETKENLLINGRQEHKSVSHVGPISASPILPVDEEMNDNEVVPSPKSNMQVKFFSKTSSFGRQSEKINQMAHTSPPSWDFSSAISSPMSPQANAKSIGKSPFSSFFINSFKRDNQVNTEAIPMQVMVSTANQEKPESPRHDSSTDNAVSEMVSEDVIEDKHHTDIYYQDAEPEEVDPNYDEEVAEAKLRLIFRMWRRHSLRRKELREQRQLAAVAALNSLPLGPPIQQSIDQPGTSRILDIDLIADERYERHDKSWSSLNVSEVIAEVLQERTISSACFCWKMILCCGSQNCDSVAISWLRSKLVPVKRDCDFDLVSSSPDLSIWKKWIPDKNGGVSRCYLSIVKEAEFNNLSETVLGSCAVSFLITEDLSLEIGRLRLQNLVSSLPSDSHLPLLIIVDSYEQNCNSSTVMADQLGLDTIDKSLVSDYLVIFLKKNQEFENFDGFLSDGELRRGLKWLADHSPLPPDVHCVKTLDLIEAYLSSSMSMLDEIGAYEVGPDHCISVFNEALNRTVANAINAANANCCSWPCPEIDLIVKTSDEYGMVNLQLPSTGWSSSNRICQLVSVLRGTELPVFEDDLSWLYRGSKSRKEIENQKQLLENCLINYLAQTSKLVGLSLATNEARAMLQKSAQLELHGSTYYIVPMWVQIFRRIFNWRLMSISSATSTVYVLEHDIFKSALGMGKLDVEDKSSPHGLIRPSLDEMIDRCTEIEVFEPSLSMVSGDSKAVNFTDSGCATIGKLRFDEDDMLEEANNVEFIDQRSNEGMGKMVVGSKPMKEAGRLNDLLEQCNILQKKIEKKLSIYF